MDIKNDERISSGIVDLNDHINFVKYQTAILQDIERLYLTSSSLPSTDNKTSEAEQLACRLGWLHAQYPQCLRRRNIPDIVQIEEILLDSYTFGLTQ